MITTRARRDLVDQPVEGQEVDDLAASRLDARRAALDHELLVAGQAAGSLDQAVERGLVGPHGHEDHARTSNRLPS